jgi:hypothetical protein
LRKEQGGQVEAADVVAYMREQGTGVPIARVCDVMRRDRDRLRLVAEEESA